VTALCSGDDLPRRYTPVGILTRDFLGKFLEISIIRIFTKLSKMHVYIDKGLGANYMPNPDRAK
jgi:hypothetical protein